MGSGASKLKYVVEISSAEEVESLKEKLSPDAVAELETIFHDLPEPPATPVSLHHAKSTAQLVHWCSQIGLQKKSFEKLVAWIKNGEENGVSFLRLEEEELEEIGLETGPLRILRSEFRKEKESHPTTPVSLHDAKSTAQLVRWCSQIGLQEKSFETLVDWIEDREENGVSFLMLEEEALKGIDLKPGPLRILLSEFRKEKEEEEGGYYDDDDYCSEGDHAEVWENSLEDAKDADGREVPQYSLEDAKDLAKFLRNADIRLVRAEYFWKLLDQVRIPPARRQELEVKTENVIKNDDGRTYTKALVSHDEIDDWAEGRTEALLCSISHSWESMEHADPTGDQCDRVASATALYAAAFGVPVWVFIDFLSIYQFEQTPEQRKKFDLAMDNMHLLYAHESTMTLRLEHLSPYPHPNGNPSKNSNVVKIWHKASKKVKDVARDQLKNNDRPYQRRGWCRVEVQWSSARSESHSNVQIDAHLGSSEEQKRKFKCQVAEHPDQFQDRTTGEEIKFNRPKDKPIVLKLQKKVFLQKANEREHLVVENVEAPEIAVLAKSIRYYKCLKSLTLRHFFCEFDQAMALCKALADMSQLPLTRLLVLYPEDAESERVLKEAFRRCKVKEKNPKIDFQTKIKEKEEKEMSMQTEEWRKRSRRPEPTIPAMLDFLQKDFSSKFFSLDDWMYKSEDDRRAVLKAFQRSVTVKLLWVAYRGHEWNGTYGSDLLKDLKKLQLGSGSSLMAFVISETNIDGSRKVLSRACSEWGSDQHCTWIGDYFIVSLKGPTENVDGQGTSMETLFQSLSPLPF